MSGGQLMVVIIVAMALIAGILKARYRHRSGDVETTTSSRDKPDADRLRDEVRTLKERIAVLERIATDRTTNLDHEIERLRDR